MRKKIKAVLDACVLIPQYLRDTLLSVAWQGLYYPYWSESILEEARSSLISKYQISSLKAVNLVAKMQSAFPEAMVEVPPNLREAMLNHPKDRHVLATAVAAKADVIVTDNLNDFPSFALLPWGIKAQSPDSFLTHLFDEDPGAIKLIIQQQVEKYKNPPKTMIELLDFLGEKAKLSQFSHKLLSYLQKLAENSPSAGSGQ
jgi:putative PIN family toxin of toxin-antitoxin system